MNIRKVKAEVLQVKIPESSCCDCAGEVNSISL